MKQINLKSMPVDDLLNLRDRISNILSKRVASERRDLESRLARLTNVQLDAPAMPRSNGRKIGKVAPKYRNPENPSETWTGRGRQPRWMTAAIKNGKKKSQFVIANGANGGRRGRKARRATAH